MVLAVLKWSGVAGFGSLPWEWALFPWWFGLCLVAFVNHRVLFGPTRLTHWAWIAAALAVILAFLRAFGASGLGGVGWWVVTAPFWGLATLCWLHTLSRDLPPAR